MSLPSLQLRSISTSEYYTSGDVTIQDGVAIAPGVLIQADPDSRIIIKTGACIGIGAILHAQNGTLEVAEGANIGAEVLLVGVIKVGANACIGTASTIINTSVQPGQMIPPGSLIGDTSRPQAPELAVTETVFYPPDQRAQPLPAPKIPEAVVATNGAAPAPDVNVYGQVYVNQLLVKMFPNRSGNSSPSSTSNTSLPAQDPWED